MTGGLRIVWEFVVGERFGNEVGVPGWDLPVEKPRRAVLTAQVIIDHISSATKRILETRAKTSVAMARKNAMIASSTSSLPHRGHRCETLLPRGNHVYPQWRQAFCGRFVHRAMTAPVGSRCGEGIPTYPLTPAARACYTRPG